MNVSARSMAGLPWLAAIAFFMQSLDNSILNTAIPTIAESLNTTPLAMRSAIISYALTVALLIPISGWVADRFGTKKVFIFAVTVFTLGSLLSSMSYSLPTLIGARVIQGIGGAMMMPVSRLAILRAYPRSELLGILNFVAIPGLVGPILGPMVGGWIVTYTSWHWIFLINIPIGVIGIIYAIGFMPDFVMPKRRFDFAGFLLFSLSLVLLSSGMVLIGDRVVSLTTSCSVLVSGILLMFLYIWHASRASQPLIRLSLFRTRMFSIGIIGCLTSRLGISCIPFLMPLMLQIGFGFSPLDAGLMMAPIAIGSITAKSMVTRVLHWFGYRKTLIGITLLTGAVIASFSLQSPEHHIIWLVIPLFIMGTLMSTQFTSMNTMTLGSLDNEYASEGNSVMAVTQQLSISFGVAISASVYSIYSSTTAGSVIDNFHYTFITMGIITFVSTLVFVQLRPHDGDNLVKRQQGKRQNEQDNISTDEV